MKTFLISLIVFFVLLLPACKSDNVNSGARGVVHYVEVNCNLDESFWEYNNYNGTLYFIVKDSANNYISVEDKIAHSDSVTAIDGEYTLSLQPAVYYSFIREAPYTSESNSIQVNLNQVTEKDFWFRKCVN